jgi:enoyl-CoA hydratase/carnithine racemase
VTRAPIQLSFLGDIAHLALDNPPKNLMDHSFFDTLTSACAHAMNRKPLAGMIVYAHGRHFSCGADLNQLQEVIQHDGSPFLTQNLKIFSSIERVAVPVVAAISGCCLGAGLELALACRHRIAAPQAMFALPESTFGIMPGCGGSVRLPLLIGKSRAIELILTGRLFGAEEALSMGVIDRIVAAQDLLETARELIGRQRLEMSAE